MFLHFFVKCIGITDKCDIIIIYSVPPVLSLLHRCLNTKYKLVNTISLMLYSVGPQWTYTQHKKPLQSIAFLESVRLVASTDGLLHVCLWLTELILPVILYLLQHEACVAKAANAASCPTQYRGNGEYSTIRRSVLRRQYRAALDSSLRHESFLHTTSLSRLWLVTSVCDYCISQFLLLVHALSQWIVVFSDTTMNRLHSVLFYSDSWESELLKINTLSWHTWYFIPNFS